MDDKERPGRILFGDFALDAAQRVLFRHGSATPLSPKAFRLLELLLDRRPEAVSKEELVERLWEGTFVSDASLHNLVAEVRAALDDDPRTARFIRTVARYGYAFHGEARQAPEADITPSRGAPSGPRLVGRQREWPLSEGSNVIGRDRDCAVYINSRTVSRHHAKIVVTSGAAMIEDLDSKNGTSVEGRKATKPVALEDGARIRIGSVTMIFRTLDSQLSTLTERRRSTSRP
jgi:DNA-binding winged helix-turn-helix (wHTH) protein